MNAPNKNQIWTALVVSLIVVGGGVGIAQAGYPNIVNDAVMYIASLIWGGSLTPTQEVRITSTVYKQGAEATYPSATAYVWYDWDHDGSIDLGNIDTGAGEIETLSTTSGVFTSAHYYPVGGSVYFQLHASTYESVEYMRTIPKPADNWDGVTAIPLGNMPMILLETQIIVTVSEADAGLLVTSSGDYDYGTYGTVASMTIRVSMNQTDHGMYTPAYTHWVTGEAYHGSFIGITMDAADSGNCVFSSYNGYEDQGSYTYVWWDLSSAIFNDADLTDDGAYSLVFTITCVGAFDWNTIGAYNSLKATEFGQQAWGSADGSETDIDFVA